ncbi:MAG: SDR family oxidoreductase [Candidatus Latescibacteria bacterium]|nr:SDR family oxidoreductase [Candidatus Latescibacterota bacterium]
MAAAECKRVLITGASRGIGRASAEAFAAAGHRVAIHYQRAGDAARELAERLPGGPHPVVQADLADASAVLALEEMAADALGGLDVLVNNAGIYEEHPPLATRPADWRRAWERTLAVNLIAPALLSQLAARRMAAAGGGRIVNVSSRGAFRGEPTAPAYGASKAGLNACGQSLARALAPAGVLVFTVAPGWVETDMAADFLAGPEGAAIRGQSPLDRAASPAEIAAAVLWLGTDAPAYATGGIVDVNGASYLRS